MQKPQIGVWQIILRIRPTYSIIRGDFMAVRRTLPVCFQQPTTSRDIYVLLRKSKTHDLSAVQHTPADSRKIWPFGIYVVESSIRVYEFEIVFLSFLQIGEWLDLLNRWRVIDDVVISHEFFGGMSASIHHQPCFNQIEFPCKCMFCIMSFGVMVWNFNKFECCYS